MNRRRNRLGLYFSPARVLLLLLAGAKFCFGTEWHEVVDLPDEADAVLTYQKWQLPSGDGHESVEARVVHMHAGRVTLELNQRVIKFFPFNKYRSIQLKELKPEDQNRVQEWRKWKPRKVYFDDFDKVVDNGDNSFNGKLVATIGTKYGIFEVADTEPEKGKSTPILFYDYRSSGAEPLERNGNFVCINLFNIEPYKRLEIYRKIFHGHFETMKVEGEDGERYRMLGFQAYKWIPGERKDFTYGLNAQLYVPPFSRNDKKLPMVVYLHESAGIGTDNFSQFKSPEILALLESSKNEPCFLLCPQSPKIRPWHGFGPGMPTDSMKAVTDMVRILVHDYPQIDPTRIYVIGSPKGDRGSLEFITCWPDTYAAAVCMWPDLPPFYFKQKKARPFWAFWNPKRNSLAEKKMPEIIKLYEKWGVPLKTTTYENKDYDPWSIAYGETGFVKWLFSQQIGKKDQGEINVHSDVNVRKPNYLLFVFSGYVLIGIVFIFMTFREKQASI